MAARGAALHADDLGALALWQWEARRLQQHTTYFLKVHQASRLQGQRRGGGLAQRQRAVGPNNRRRVEGTDALGVTTRNRELGRISGLQSMRTHILQGQATRASEAMAAATYPFEDTGAAPGARASARVGRGMEVSEVYSCDTSVAEDTVHMAQPALSIGASAQR